MSATRFVDTLKVMQERRSTILAFNIVDLASLHGVLDAAAAAGEPVITQFSSRTVIFYGARLLCQAVRVAAAQSNVTAFVHLDHCRDDRVLEDCIASGFDGVMADGSHLPVEENIRWTSQWRSRTADAGCVLEAEYSAIRGAEEDIDDSNSVTREFSFADFKRYSEAVRPDLIGADIGTSHGSYDEGEPELDESTLASVLMPGLPGFVVHGGSGLSRSTLSRLATGGVRKINFSTDLKAAWREGVADVRSLQGDHEPLALLANARTAIRNMAKTKWNYSVGSRS